MTSRTAKLAPVLLCATLGLTACGSSDGSGEADASSSASSSASASASGTASAGPSGTASPAAGTCQYADDTLAPAAKKVDKPPATPTVSGTVKVVLATNQGDIPLDLDAASAPCAVNSFVSLAQQKYYDNSPCSRVLSDSRGVGILQCGDPSGTGGGGPGYTYAEELKGNEQYSVGVVAMAKRQSPASTGGQFFMMFADSTKAFTPDYTILGKVANPKALKVLQKAGQVAMTGKPDGYDGQPASPVIITGVTVK